jgi:hypothetical protein
MPEEIMIQDRALGQDGKRRAEDCDGGCIKSLIL